MATNPQSTTQDPETGGDSYIRIDNLRKTFDNGQIVAVDDISVDIGQDEFVVLLGPSGCGKTTTLRCIAGLEIPDSGHIFVDDEDITDEKPKNRDLAYVFQSIALFPHMTIRDNIKFGLDMKTELGEEEKDQRVTEAAEILGIEDMLNRKPSQLSGGQQQRVSLGRAMVMEPAAFLLDEPLSALDANLRDQMRIELQELQNRLETTMIFVTHDQMEAMTIGDKIIILDGGSIKQAGSPQEIYNEPENLFVANFIGSPSTNVIEGSIEIVDGTPVVETDIFALDLPEADVAKLEAGQRVSLGIRPEYLNITDSHADFRADINVVEHLGDRDALYLDVDGHELTALVPQSTVNDDDPVDVHVERSEVWLFDADGDRIV